MAVKTLLRSFAAGEITPELAGRIDLDKRQTGLKTSRNFIVLPHGPAANRAGFAYTLETKDSTKTSVLIPFIYSTDQAYVLEFGDQYMRIHTLGGTVLETAQNITGITQANPGVLTYSGADPTNGQWFYLASIGGMTQLNGRYVKVANVNAGANTFELTDTAGNNINTTSYGAYTAGGTMSRVYEISTPYLEADLENLHYTQSADVLTIVHPGYQQRQLSRLGATNWTLSTFSLSPTQVAPTGVTVTPSAGGGTTYTYVVCAVASDGLEVSLASASGTNAACQALSAAGAYNTVTWAAASGAVRYNVYKLINGLYGYIGQAAGTSFVDDNIVPDTGDTPPEANDPFSGAGNYPGAVGYFEGRRWFGGTTNKPQNLYGTRSGTESNMSRSIPTKSDDSISVRLLARQANTIRHIVPLSDLLLLTSGAEWRVTAQNSDAITPSSISYRPEGYIGASNVTPVVASGAVVYAQDRGGRIRELLYAWESSGYKTNDISIMAPHLFQGYNIVSMAYCRAPYSIVWAVRDDGVLLGVTYVPEHKVVGWHRHDTDGTFESVASIPEGDEDVLYAIVKRSINGRTVRYVERLSTRIFETLADSFIVDAGATYDSTPATTITGLWHLEGEDVSVLADGAVVRDKTVTNGSITLDQAASVVHVGLPITADLETLPLAMEAMAMGQGTQKNVNKVWLQVNESSSVWAGPTTDKLRQFKQRTTEPYGSPPSLTSGEIEVSLTPEWNRTGTVCVQQTDPLPITVLAMTLEVAIGG